jgi:hypothetical protein
MTESYILFSAISSGSGARNLWLADGGLAGGRPGLVNGIAMPVAAPAFDAHDSLSPAFKAGGGAANGIQLLASLDWLSEGNAGFASSFLAATLEDSRAFAVPAGPLNPVLTGDLNAFPQPGPFFAFGTLAFGLADRDWNSVKNLELSIDSEDLAGLEQITLRNIVDVRVKLGDTEAPPPREEGAFDRFISLDIQNAKRGSVDASESEFNVSLTLSTTSNGRAGQNSFDLVLSAFDDLVLLMAGDQAGRTFQNFRLVNDGSLSLVTTDLGAGDDTFIAFSGRATTVTSGGADTGELTVTTLASPLPGLIPDFTRVELERGDTLVAGAGRDTFRYAAGDGVDSVLDFNKAFDTIAIERSLQGETQLLVVNGSTLILFDDLPVPGPGSTAYTAGIFVQDVVLVAADLVWLG